MAIRLRGWQRLWVVACVPLLAFGAWKALEDEWLPVEYKLKLFVVFGVLPCVALYAIEWAGAWIIRGFREHDE